MIGIVGYTGVVGHHICEQYFIDKFYNSKNITEIHGMHFDLLFISAISALKYIANKDGPADKEKIDLLFQDLAQSTADKVVFISTIDVHNGDNYGNNRLYAEKRITELFSNVSIIRLPGLVGKYIKKNFIYDICHGKDLSYTSINSSYEFMNMEDLHKFIDMCLFTNTPLLEIRSEPLKVADICKVFGIDSSLLNTSEGINYSHEGINRYTCEEELNFIRDYVEKINFANK